MRLLLLGAGGFHPCEARHTACLLAPELGLMIDAGTGAFRVQHHVATPRLDIFLSHGHLDHVVGLTYLLLLEREGKPVETVVHAATGVIEAVQQHLLAPALFPVSPVSRFEPLENETVLPSGAELRAFPLDHPGGSHGFRVDAGGKSFAYTSDTKRLGAESIEAIRGVDLLVHEANFTEADREFADLTGHSTAADAAWAASEAGVGRLVMVHHDPRAEGNQSEVLAEARALFPKAEYGDDGQEIVI